MLDEKKWVKINKFPESVGHICSIYEINNEFYVVGEKGISTLNNNLFYFPSNYYYNWCASCQVGNNVLFIRTKSEDYVESKLFNTVSKQWSDVNIETKRKGFDVVHYLNKVWIVGGDSWGYGSMVPVVVKHFTKHSTQYKYMIWLTKLLLYHQLK